MNREGIDAGALDQCELVAPGLAACRISVHHGAGFGLVLDPIITQAGAVDAAGAGAVPKPLGAEAAIRRPFDGERQFRLRVLALVGTALCRSMWLHAVKI